MNAFDPPTVTINLTGTTRVRRKRVHHVWEEASNPYDDSLARAARAAALLVLLTGLWLLGRHLGWL